MSALLQLYLNQFLVFVLVLARVGALVTTAPILGARTAPMQVRGLLAVALSLLVTPLYWQTEVPYPGNLMNMGVMLGRETLIGLALGLGVTILFSGIQLTGQVVGQMSGMSLGDVFDPQFDNNVSVFSQLMDLVTLSVFVLIGGHRQVMGALLETFHWMPPGSAGFSADLVESLQQIAAQSFLLGARASIPLMLSLLLSVLIMGLISRTLPQLNVMAVGFSLNSLVVLAVLSVTLGSVAWVFQEQVATTLDTLREGLAKGR
jgi:flagellar biosynthetic protein FliR